MSSICLFVYISAVPCAVPLTDPKEPGQRAVMTDVYDCRSKDLPGISERALNQKILHLSLVLNFRSWTLLHSCFSCLGILIATNHFCNYLPLDFLFKQVDESFLVPVCATPQKEPVEDKSVPYWHRFSHYWIKTNMDMSPDSIPTNVIFHMASYPEPNVK